MLRLCFGFNCAVSNVIVDGPASCDWLSFIIFILIAFFTQNAHLTWLQAAFSMWQLLPHFRAISRGVSSLKFNKLTGTSCCTQQLKHSAWPVTQQLAARLFPASSRISLLMPFSSSQCSVRIEPFMQQTWATLRPLLFRTMSTGRPTLIRYLTQLRWSFLAARWPTVFWSLSIIETST